MGYGRSQRQEELRSLAPASAGFRSLLKRRTATRVTCGVCFLLLSLAHSSCTGHAPKQIPTRDQLTIGVPEGVVEGTELGVQSLVSMLSVESISQLSDDGRSVPKLAESWWWSNDGLQLNINLRPGIQFHDGSPLTATVTAKILEQAIHKRSNRALFTSFSDIKSIRTAGDRQVIVELTQPSAFLPDDLEVPIEIGTPAEGVGTGPYRVVKRDGGELVFERFEHYYLGAPRIGRISAKPFDTLRNAWTSLLRGDVDMVTDVPPDAVEFISNDQVRVVSFGRRYQYLLALNLNKPPFNSALVRRALNTAIDRPALIANALKGHGIPSTGPLWPKHWAYNKAIASYRFDPGLATSLFNSAGLRADKRSVGPEARFKFTCLIPENFNVLERVALEVQKQLYDVGVDMQFEVVPSREFDSRIRDGKFDAMLIDSISGPTIGRSYMFWRSAKRFPGGLNFFGYENLEAERLFDLMRTSTNEIAVRSAYARLQEILLNDPPAVFLAWNERSRAVRKDFEIVQDPHDDPADPIYSMWRWTATRDPQVARAQ